MHAASVAFEKTEQWGSLDTRLEWSQYLHDRSLTRLEAEGELSWRLARGFSLSMEGNASRVRDQISLPRRGSKSPPAYASRIAMRERFTPNIARQNAASAAKSRDAVPSMELSTALVKPSSAATAGANVPDDSPIALSSLDTRSWPGSLREMLGAVLDVARRLGHNVLGPEHLMVVGAENGAPAMARLVPSLAAFREALLDYHAAMLAFGDSAPHFERMWSRLAADHT